MCVFMCLCRWAYMCGYTMCSCAYTYWGQRTTQSIVCSSGTIMATLTLTNKGAIHLIFGDRDSHWTGTYEETGWLASKPKGPFCLSSAGITSTHNTLFLFYFILFYFILYFILKSSIWDLNSGPCTYKANTLLAELSPQLLLLPCVGTVFHASWLNMYYHMFT